MIKTTVALILAMSSLGSNSALAADKSCHVVFSQSVDPLLDQLAKLKFEIAQLRNDGQVATARVLNNNYLAAYREAVKIGLDLSSLPTRIQKLTVGEKSRAILQESLLDRTRMSESNLSIWVSGALKLEVLAGGSYVNSQAVFSRDGRGLFVVTPDNSVSKFEISSSKLTPLLDLQLKNVSIKVSPDESTVFAFGSNTRSEPILQVFDIRSRRLLFEQKASAYALSPDGTRLALIGKYDGEIKVISTQDWQAISKIRTGRGGERINSLEITTDNSAVMINLLGDNQLWNIATQRLIKSTGAEKSSFDTINPEQTLIASTYGKAGRVSVLRPGDKRPLFVLEGSVGRIFVLAFTPDSSQLIATSADGFVYAWNMNDGSLRSRVRTLGTPRTLNISADGRSVVVSSGEIGTDMEFVHFTQLK